MCYDKLFHKIAKNKGLISEGIGKTKQMSESPKGKKSRQRVYAASGQVYGKYIWMQSPHHYQQKHSADLKRIRMAIVSHKTRTPYEGPPYDLHKAAWEWLKKNNFLSKDGLNISESDVYFEETKEKKINRIKAIKCTHYIDDLKEILELLPDTMERIHYNRAGHDHEGAGIKVINNWEIKKLEKLLRV